MRFGSLGHLPPITTACLGSIRGDASFDRSCLIQSSAPTLDWGVVPLPNFYYYQKKYYYYYFTMI